MVVFCLFAPSARASDDDEPPCSSEEKSPVDLGHAALCGLAGKVGICADMTMFRGTARFGGPPGSPTSHFDQAVATYAGLTVGVASW